MIRLVVTLLILFCAISFAADSLKAHSIELRPIYFFVLGSGAGIHYEYALQNHLGLFGNLVAPTITPEPLEENWEKLFRLDAGANWYPFLPQGGLYLSLYADFLQYRSHKMNDHNDWVNHNDISLAPLLGLGYRGNIGETLVLRLGIAAGPNLVGDTPGFAPDVETNLGFMF